jgi:hypothetical protein
LWECTDTFLDGGSNGLSPRGERRKSEADSKNDREPDQPHGHLSRGRLLGSLVERQDAHQHSVALKAPSAHCGGDIRQNGDDWPNRSSAPGKSRDSSVTRRR